MSIYDRKLEGTDDIFNAIKEIVDKGNLGNKIEIVRMFSAARREYELNQLKDKFEEKCIELLNTYNRTEIVPVYLEEYDVDLLWNSDSV